MRKIQLTLLALLIFQFGCEPAEDTGPTTIDYGQVSDGFSDMFKGAFGLTESLQLVSIVDQTKNQLMVKIEVENISKAATGHFASYFNGVQGLNGRIFYPAPPLSSAFNQENAIQTVENVIDTASIFNDIQKMYIKALSKEIAVAESYGDGFELVNSFRNKVIQASELSDEDKILLLEIAAGSKALLEFIEAGGVQKVQNDLVELLGNDIPNGRIAGCSVDWRGVWMGGVLNLLGGATIGGLTGAFAGSFTIPLLGTVAGAVNGAVIGGAVGFTTGVLYGIVGDLMTSCFRPDSPTLQQTYSSCGDAWEAYMTGKTNTMPSKCFVVEIPI